MPETDTKVYKQIDDENVEVTRTCIQVYILKKSVLLETKQKIKDKIDNTLLPKLNRINAELSEFE